MTTSEHGGDSIELELEDVTKVDVRIVGGEVTVAAGGNETDAVRLEVEVLRGPPAEVDVVGGVLVVEHQPVRSLGGLLAGVVGVRANVNVIVPENTDVHVRTVNGDVFVAGVRSTTSITTVAGGVTATGLDGETGLRSVSGAMVVQGIGGVVRANSVSGDVTLSGGDPTDVTARSVSGEVILSFDVVPEIECTTVSGDVAVRLPAAANLDLDVATVSGRLESSFPDALDAAKRRLRGRIGDGGSRVAIRTTSGDVTVLRRASVQTRDEVEA